MIKESFSEHTSFHDWVKLTDSNDTHRLSDCDSSHVSTIGQESISLNISYYFFLINIDQRPG